MSKEKLAIAEMRALLRPNLVTEEVEVSPYQVGFHDGLQRMAREAWEVLEMHCPEPEPETVPQIEARG